MGQTPGAIPATLILGPPVASRFLQKETSCLPLSSKRRSR